MLCYCKYNKVHTTFCISQYVPLTIAYVDYLEDYSISGMRSATGRCLYYIYTYFSKIIERVFDTHSKQYYYTQHLYFAMRYLTCVAM